MVKHDWIFLGLLKQRSSLGAKCFSISFTGPEQNHIISRILLELGIQNLSLVWPAGARPSRIGRVVWDIRKRSLGVGLGVQNWNLRGPGSNIQTIGLGITT